MLFAYALDADALDTGARGTGALRKLPPDAALTGAAWLDLYRPQIEQVEAVTALGVEVPTLEAMQEIELSNRLYRAGAFEYMTAILPGQTPDGAQIMGPVTFILSPDLLVTVRHHNPRPFRVYPERAASKAAGCKSTDRLFLGLIEEVIARLADLLEAADRTLETTGRGLFNRQDRSTEAMETALDGIAREAETLARVRLALMTLERVISYFELRVARKRADKTLGDLVRAALRDLVALTEHADFVATRMGQISDAALGMITLDQNATARILSVVAALFLPPTLIASLYGMNFQHMPELASPYGYPIVLGGMAASALLTFLYFKWRKWL